MKKKDEKPKARKGYKYSLRLTPRQRKAIDCFIRGVNLIYNKGLKAQFEQYEIYKAYVQEHGIEKAKKNKIYSKIGGFPLIKMYKVWRDENTEDGKLLQLCPATFLVQKLKDLELAYNNFFRGNAQRPAYKINENYGSFRYLISEKDISNHSFFIEDQPGFALRWVKVPFLGKLTFYCSRPFLGIPKNVTISRIADRYYISIQTELEIDDELPKIEVLKEVAIDFGLEPFLSLSNGEQYEAINPYQAYQYKLSSLHKGMKRCAMRSVLYNKYKLKWERLHRDIQFMRDDWIHKLTTDLANRFDIIYIPDIKIKEWDKAKSQNKKLDDKTKKEIAKIENHNKRLIRKKLRDCAWEKFTRLLAYKLQDRNAQLIKIEMPRKEENQIEQVNTDFPYMISSVEKAKELLEYTKRERIN